MLTRLPTPDEMDAMADTAAAGASRFGPLPCWAAALREEAQRQRQWAKEAVRDMLAKSVAADEEGAK